MPETAGQSVLFPNLFSKPVTALFSDEQSSTDGGLILLAPIDQKLGLTARIAAAMVDSRQLGKVRHATEFDVPSAGLCDQQWLSRW
jgi:hypothetical protein